MQLLSFDTSMVAPEARLATFRSGAPAFRITSLVPARSFSSRWRMLKLGDLNVIHAHISPARYERDAAMIAADGEDRITIHYCIQGMETGTIDGNPVTAGPGGAMVWDLARPLDVASTGDNESIIITLPRYIMDEVLPSPSIAGPVPPSPELQLAADQARNLLDRGSELPDAASVFYGRALRDMFAVAMLPAYRPSRMIVHADRPILERILAQVDSRISEDIDIDDLAATLGMATAIVAAVVDRFGGLALVAERRRLLAAYRLLRDPAETATVGTIAHRCGFSSLPEFSRRFHSVFHTSASDLRRHGVGQLPRWAGAYHVERHYEPLLSARDRSSAT